MSARCLVRKIFVGVLAGCRANSEFKGLVMPDQLDRSAKGVDISWRYEQAGFLVVDVIGGADAVSRNGGNAHPHGGHDSDLPRRSLHSGEGDEVEYRIPQDAVAFFLAQPIELQKVRMLRQKVCYGLLADNYRFYAGPPNRLDQRHVIPIG